MLVRVKKVYYFKKINRNFVFFIKNNYLNKMCILNKFNIFYLLEVFLYVFRDFNYRI